MKGPLNISVRIWNSFVYDMFSKIGRILFLSFLLFRPSFIPSFCQSVWNFNLANNFWIVRARALIFHLSISKRKSFPWALTFLTFRLDLGLLFEKFNLANTFWTMIAGALIFHMRLFWYKSFHEYKHLWACDLDPGMWPTF